jgi:hypothetical protein
MVDIDLPARLSAPKVSYACSKVVRMLADVQQLGKDAAEFAAAPLWPLPILKATMS